MSGLDGVQALVVADEGAVRTLMLLLRRPGFSYGFFFTFITAFEVCF